MGIIEKMRLDGKNIIATGGARGIGKSVATAFAEAGANLAIIDIDFEVAKEVADCIKKEYKVNAIAIKVDVINYKDIDHMMSVFLGTFETLDVAFCNAGICINEPADEMSIQNFKKVIDVNLTGVFLTAQAADKQMIYN